MDYMKEHDILIETVASQQGTIRKLVDEIARLNEQKQIVCIGEKHPEPTERPCPMPTYPPVFMPFLRGTDDPLPQPYKVTCSGESLRQEIELLDSADKERMLNGDRTD